MMACRPWLEANWGATPSTKLSALFSLLGLLWQFGPSKPAGSISLFSPERSSALSLPRRSKTASQCSREVGRVDPELIQYPGS